ncbi:MAG: membrane integrity-associated transporter subunit PqiC [Deltaproteobacteria bacterium]|jgi:uncharacterized lipoprotein YmbA|nr:membrane integrity-associated transporter subunit PqiC [Deltaproteobacteria bacterium]MBW2537965.1 membrane integrity-associated transporter subunit PqiC [Deltaproteobacteria bacterium]
MGWRTRLLEGGRIAAAAALLALGLGPLAGCALTSKSDPVSPRYLSPALGSSGAEAKRGAGRKLRLYRVRAGAHLKQKLVSRTSPYEVRFYEERRWVEQPDDLVARAISKALFEERGVRRVVTGAAPTLEIDLIHFDEVLGHDRKVRVGMIVLLYDDGVSLLEETMIVEKKVGESDDLDDWEQFAKVAGEALREAVDRAADRIVSRLP